MSWTYSDGGAPASKKGSFASTFSQSANGLSYGKQRLLCEKGVVYLLDNKGNRSIYVTDPSDPSRFDFAKADSSFRFLGMQKVKTFDGERNALVYETVESYENTITSDASTATTKVVSTWTDTFAEGLGLVQEVYQVKENMVFVSKTTRNSSKREVTTLRTNTAVAHYQSSSFQPQTPSDYSSYPKTPSTSGGSSSAGQTTQTPAAPQAGAKASKQAVPTSIRPVEQDIYVDRFGLPNPAINFPLLWPLDAKGNLVVSPFSVTTADLWVEFGVDREKSTDDAKVYLLKVTFHNVVPCDLEASVKLFNSSGPLDGNNAAELVSEAAGTVEAATASKYGSAVASIWARFSTLPRAYKVQITGTYGNCQLK